MSNYIILYFYIKLNYIVCHIGYIILQLLYYIILYYIKSNYIILYHIILCYNILYHIKLNLLSYVYYDYYY